MYSYNIYKINSTITQSIIGGKKPSWAGVGKKTYITEEIVLPLTEALKPAIEFTNYIPTFEEVRLDKNLKKFYFDLVDILEEHLSSLEE